MRLPVALAVALLAGPASSQTVEPVDAFPGVRFASPVELVAAPGSPDRAYVVEQGGRIRTATVGGGEVRLALDLTDRVTAGGELGLLGLAFHPDYARNGRVFVSYTAPVTPRQNGTRVAVSRVSEFARSAADPLAIDPASERVVLEVDQPYDNHNGGQIWFGPDGHLYVALGDGGGAGDPKGNGQNRATLLGAILRLGVDAAPTGAPYAIPTDNPFVGNTEGWREEIYAYGLRNPWKSSVDPATGDLWTGDVGQGRWEEIDRIVAGGNYGWDQVEGPVCYPSGTEVGCDLSAYVAPVYSYPHTAEGGLSISGGIVYRGTAVPSLAGRYVYGDFVLKKLWAYDPATQSNTLLTDALANIASVNRGPDGEAYVVTYGGTVYRLVAAVTSAEALAVPALTLALAGASPFRSGVDVVASAPPGEPARLVLVDVLGREVRRLHDGPLAGPVRVDGAGLAPGLYLVRLVTRSGTASLPVVRSR